MSHDFRRDWDGAEWERFALRLVQVRHCALFKFGTVLRMYRQYQTRFAEMPA